MDEPITWVIVVAGTSWDGAQLSDQRVARRLLPYAKVLYVDPPRPSARPWLAAHPQPVPGFEHLYRLSPTVPRGARRAGWDGVVTRSVTHAVAMANRRLGITTAAVLSVSITAATALRSMVDGPSVFWAKDDYSVAADLLGEPQRKLDRDRRLLSTWGGDIVAVSPRLVDQIEALGHSPVLIPPGCELPARSPAAGNRTAGPPVVGYLGQISERIDLSILEALTDDGIALRLIGSVQRTFTQRRRLDTLLARPTVDWVGPKSGPELDDAIATLGVGLVPYTSSEFNQASFPLKVFEYLAAGLPVVSTDLPAVASLESPHIRLARNAPEFVVATRQAIAVSRDVEQRRDRVAYAAANTWEERAARYAEVLRLVPQFV